MSRCFLYGLGSRAAASADCGLLHTAFAGPRGILLFAQWIPYSASFFGRVLSWILGFSIDAASLRLNAVMELRSGMEKASVMCEAVFSWLRNGRQSAPMCKRRACHKTAARFVYNADANVCLTAQVSHHSLNLLVVELHKTGAVIGRKEILKGFYLLRDAHRRLFLSGDVNETYNVAKVQAPPPYWIKTYFGGSYNSVID